MHDLAFLRDLLILVAFAIPTVALTERLKVPSIVAFLLAGMAIGPHGLGLISQPDEVVELAELGVILLLFEIGLEQSLSGIVRMGSVVLIGGFFQVGLTIGLSAGVGVVFGVPRNPAIAFGCLLALSSTAIVLKGYRDRGELDTPHGRMALGILIFQDLAVVPLMILLPLLAEGSAGGPGGVLRTVGASAGVLLGVVVAGRVAVPWVLERVAGLRNRELFTLTIGLIGLGAAFATASVGLSLALGAFLAGLILSESEYGAQALSDVLPFRSLFSGIFFTSVGMLLDLGFVAANAPLVLGIAAAVILGKALIVTGVGVWGLRRSLYSSLVAGLGLAQVGEFSFVLADVAVARGLVSEQAFQVLLAVTVLSMVATPLMQQGARAVASGLTRRLGRTGGGGEPFGKTHAPTLRDHAIIVGYGLSGQHLARVLRAAHLPYVVLEVNGQTVRRARQERIPISFGDGTRPEVLEHAGIRDARVVIFNISSPLDERRGVSVARSLNPTIKIVVRTRTVAAIEDLEKQGATDVVVEEYEAVLELFQRILGYYRIPSNTVAVELAAIRSMHYGVLRGVAKEALHLNELRYLGIQHVLDLVEVEPGAEAVGRSPVSLDVRGRTGATVIGVIRNAVPVYTFEADFAFAAGDVVVILGESPTLRRAARLFQAPDDAS